MSYSHEYVRKIQRQLELPEIPERITLARRGDFLFTIINEDNSEALIATLERRDPQSDWGFREWIEEAMLYPGFAVSVRREGDAEDSGFLVFDTRVFIHGWQNAPDTSRVSICLEPKAVYVAPDARGHGFGSAFVELLAGQLQHTLAAVAATSSDQFRHLGMNEIRLAIEGDCVSEEGFRFMGHALDRCKTAHADFAETYKGRWPVAVGVEDCIDYDEWGNDHDPQATP